MRAATSPAITRNQPLKRVILAGDSHFKHLEKRNVAKLNKRFPNARFMAESGRKLNQLISTIQMAKPDSAARYVVVCIGYNDTNKLPETTALTSLYTQLKHDILSKFPNAKLYAVEIPPCRRTFHKRQMRDTKDRHRSLLMGAIRATFNNVILLDPPTINLANDSFYYDENHLNSATWNILLDHIYDHISQDDGQK